MSNEMIRQFLMPDGRPIAIDKFAIAFVCQQKEDPARVSIIGFKTLAKPVPVIGAYDEIVAWWTWRPVKPARADGHRAGR